MNQDSLPEEAYDYTAQTLLQAPLETRKKRSSPRKMVVIAILCFALSYGVASAIYLLDGKEFSLVQIFGTQIFRGGVFLTLAVIASAGIVALVLRSKARKPARQKVAQAQEPQEPQESKEPKKSYESYASYEDRQFYFNLNSLLKKKAFYLLQSLFVVFFGVIFFGILALETSFAILLIALLFLIVLHNQYVQRVETLLQSTLQQIYQHSSPINSYNQLNAIKMLYALAFVESKLTQTKVIIEFQNILKLTQSSWYQKKYSSSPSILVEEVLRKLISALNFHRLLCSDTKMGKLRLFLREVLLYLLFLRNFQNFRAFRSHASVSLLSQIDSSPYTKGLFSNVLAHNFFQNHKNRIQPKFILENYYLVGIDLSNLHVKEAHFQNCQLSHSTWANSDLSDCSISSSRLDQAILSHSKWRRFLWHDSIAREIDMEHCFCLQGNIESCKLQGIQNQPHWTLQHCLLQECDLSRSAFSIDTWQSVTASNCNWHGSWLILGGEQQPIENAPPLKNRLQIKP